MFILFTLVLFGQFNSESWTMDTKGYRNISADQFVKMMAQKDFTLINVHIPYQGEIARTDLQIPLNRIDRYKNQLPDNKNTKIVVYCMMGLMEGFFIRSAFAGYRSLLIFFKCKFERYS